MSDDTDNGRLDARAIAAMLRRRLAVILLCALAVPASAFAFSVLQPTSYTATASLLFRDPELDQKLFGTSLISGSTDPAREAATNVKLVALDAVAERTAAKIGGGARPEQVTQSVEVAAEGDSDVVSVTATAPRAEEAATLANTFGSEYIAFRRGADRSSIDEARRLVGQQLTALAPEEREGPRGRSLAERYEQLAVFGALQTGNAELVQRARPPSSASSPQPLRNAAMGAVLGLLLGAGLGLLLERLDRRLKNVSEVERAFGRPLLGTVPESRSAPEAGGKLGDLLPAESEAFRMLRANLRYFSVDRPITSVLVTSAAAGEGKSTVSRNLAAAAAESGARVLLVEADLRRPTLAASLLGAPAFRGLSTLLAGEAELAEAIVSVPVAHRMNGKVSDLTMDVLFAGPTPPNPVDLIESASMQELLRQAEEAYDLVLVDTPPTSIVSDAIPLLRKVSGVIVVSRLGASTRDGAAHLRAQLENFDAPVLGVVVNCVRPSAAAYGYGYEPEASTLASRDRPAADVVPG